MMSTFQQLHNQKLIYDKSSLETSTEANTLIDLIKFIVVCYLLENIVSFRITLSDDLVMETSSDFMYDYERTILDNIYRTLIVKKRF